jgi:CheY-like chemotaxis protein
MLRVLVVDDVPEAADGLARVVRLWGHEAEVAYTGAAALERAAGYRPDVLLIDLAMPGMDGCGLAKQLCQRADGADTLLVAVTGHHDAAHRQEARQAGFDDFFPKPVNLPDLEQLLQSEWVRRAGTRK